MYEVHFRLRKKPFSLVPDPDFLFLSKTHQRVLNLLEYGLLDQAGFIVVTGPVGTGKTTLIRHLLNKRTLMSHLLDKKRSVAELKVAVIYNTQLSPEEFLDPVLEGFGLPYREKSRTERIAILRDFHQKSADQGHQLSLIIDEAQNLPLETMEEIRLLTNLEAGEEHRMQIVLVGQPGLRTKLQDPRMLPFAQRVLYDCNLLPLNATEAAQYIRHRLRIAQAEDEKIFTERAIERIHHHSRGVPRLINLLAHTALVFGFADKLPGIDGDVIEDVVKEWAAGDRPPMTVDPESIPEAGGGEDLASLKSVVEELRADQEQLIKVVELLSREEGKKESSFFSRSRKSKDEVQAWTGLRKLIEERDQEISRYKDQVARLEVEIRKLKEQGRR